MMLSAAVVSGQLSVSILQPSLVHTRRKCRTRPDELYRGERSSIVGRGLDEKMLTLRPESGPNGEDEGGKKAWAPARGQM
jgi:hypothetical protein